MYINLYLCIMLGVTAKPIFWGYQHWKMEVPCGQMAGLLFRGIKKKAYLSRQRQSSLKKTKQKGLFKQLIPYTYKSVLSKSNKT